MNRTQELVRQGWYSGPIPSRCHHGSSGRGKSVSGQAYLIPLTRLVAVRVGLSGTRIGGNVKQVAGPNVQASDCKTTFSALVLTVENGE